MSWSVSATGRASAMADKIMGLFEKAGGCPPGSVEEHVKNLTGDAVEHLCGSMRDTNNVVRVEASGSCWAEGGVAKSQTLSVKFETLYNFVE